MSTIMDRFASNPRETYAALGELEYEFETVDMGVADGDRLFKATRQVLFSQFSKLDEHPMFKNEITEFAEVKT